MQEEIFSKSIELEPAWVGKTILDGYVMRALEIEKVGVNMCRALNTLDFRALLER